jgi:hypothetical protein
MEADTSPFRRAETLLPDKGGTVEPANRATVVKALYQTPIEVAGERYELRDALAELTYRSNNITDIIAKANQLGSSRFVAIDADGKRTTIQRVDGAAGPEWQRGPQRPAAPERTVDPTERDEVPDVPGAEAKANRATGTREAAPGIPDATDNQAVARLDAQAERAALVARLQAALTDRYIIKRAPVTVGDVSIGRTEYRFRGDTSRVAFTESTFRLATDTNSPSVARSMVDVAEARDWKALRVSGHEEFRRQVWFEASLRGVKTIGYEPLPSDQAWLRSEREARRTNRIEPAREAAGDKAAGAAPAEKGSARGSGGRKAVLVAIEAVLVAKRVPEKQREAIMTAAAEKLAQRMRDGQAPKVKVYDKTAPSQRPVVVPVPEVQRTRERSAPVR